MLAYVSLLSVIKTDIISEAKIFRTTYSKVPISEIINTHLFDFDKAAIGAGWLQSLREASDYTDANGITKRIPKPETEE